MKTLKFHQLAIGSSFQYQGQSYTKFNAVMARQNSTQQQVLIKRSADVLIGEPSQAGDEAQDQQQDTRLGDALQAMQQACMQQLKACQDGVSPALLEAELNRIRLELLQRYSR